MTHWKLEFDQKALRNFEKLSKPDQVRVRKFIDGRLLPMEDPRKVGKALSGGFSGLWRYRVRNIRLVARIQDDELVILVLKLDHRRDVYR